MVAFSGHALRIRCGLIRVMGAAEPTIDCLAYGVRNYRARYF